MKNKLLVLLLVLALSPCIQMHSVEAKNQQTKTLIQHKVDIKQCQKYVNSGYQELYSKKNVEIIQNYGFEKLTEELDKDRNGKDFKRGQVNLISTDDSKVKVYVIPTDEELTIARDVVSLTK